MPRPTKSRVVCSMPETQTFGPDRPGNEIVILSVDQYETIRLID